MQGRAIRTSRYKYMAYSWGERPEQLYDLERDPGETRNLAREPGHGSALDEHRKLLAVHLRKTGDAFEPPARVKA
jgi:choline-sulfatase